jgi:hypothetical protein
MAALDGVNGTVCNAQQYLLSIPSASNPNPSISCLSHGQAIGLAVGILPFRPFRELIPFRVQLTAEASLLSFVSVLAIYVLIGVSLTPLHAFVWFDEMSHSGIYDGIRDMSQGMSGGCFRDLLTSTWFV